jgi:serine/threonine protein kinase
MNPEIPGYEILEVLGQGGMATVYLAKQLKFDRIVALKIMSPQLASDDSFKVRFIHEARIVAKISHPNIVAVYDVGEYEGHNYLSMEYHDGGDLKAKIQDGIDVKECLYIIKDVCKALDFAHTNSIIHRDIKPDNILFRFDQSAVLADFGIAKALESESDLTQIGTAIGTPKYMSPEQTTGVKVTNQSDLYSVGVVLYEMLTGTAPYSAKDHIATAVMHYNEPIPILPPESLFIQPLLNKLLAKKPKDRFASGKDVVDSLNKLISAYNNQDKTVIMPKADGDKTIFITSAAQTLTRVVVTLRRKPKIITVGIGLSLILAAGAWYMLFNGPSISDTTPLLAAKAKLEVGILKTTAQIKVTSSSDITLIESSVLDKNNQTEIARLLSQFEGLFAADRLKTPRDKNAVLVTNKILLLDPENKPALDNQKRIGRRYLNLASQAADQGNFKKSQNLLTSAGEFLSDGDILKVREKIESKQANSGQQKVIALREKLRKQALSRQEKED